MSTTTTKTDNTSIHCGLVLLLAFWATDDVSAQQWRFEPILALTAEYNDNLRLFGDNEVQEEETLLTVDANGRFVRRTATGEVRIAPRVRSRSYTENTVDDTTDLFFDFFVNKRTERSEVGIQARYSQEDVLTAEIDDPDFDNPDVNAPVNLDTGRIRIQNDREYVIVSPYLTHDWTETLGFTLDASYIDVSYDESPLDLIDYRSASLGAALVFTTSERSSWSIRLNGDDYEAEDSDTLTESQSAGIALEFRHQFSQTLEGKIGAGYQNIDSDRTETGATISTTEHATLFSAGLTQTGEISRWIFDASQAVDPGGSGFLQKRAQVRLHYSRQLSPKTYANFEARVQRTEELSTAAIQLERDFQRFRVGLERRITESWSINAAYTFTMQEYSDEAGDATSNAVSLGFVYQPPQLR